VAAVPAAAVMRAMHQVSAAAICVLKTGCELCRAGQNQQKASRDVLVHQPPHRGWFDECCSTIPACSMGGFAQTKACGAFRSKEQASSGAAMEKKGNRRNAAMEKRGNRRNAAWGTGAMLLHGCFSAALGRPITLGRPLIVWPL